MGHDFRHLVFLTIILCTSSSLSGSLRRVGPGKEHIPPGTTASPTLHTRLHTGAAEDCVYSSVVPCIIIGLGVTWFPLQVFSFSHEHLLN